MRTVLLIVGWRTPSAAVDRTPIYLGECGVEAAKAADAACESGNFSAGAIKRYRLIEGIPLPRVPRLKPAVPTVPEPTVPEPKDQPEAPTAPEPTPEPAAVAASVRAEDLTPVTTAKEPKAPKAKTTKEPKAPKA